MRACSFSCSGSQTRSRLDKRASGRTRHSRDPRPCVGGVDRNDVYTRHFLSPRQARRTLHTEARRAQPSGIPAETRGAVFVCDGLREGVSAGRSRQPRLLERPMRTSCLPANGTSLLSRTRADPRVFSCTHQHPVGSSSPHRTSGGPSARRTRAAATVTPGECLACRWLCGASVWTGTGPGERLVVEPHDTPLAS